MIYRQQHLVVSGERCGFDRAFIRTLGTYLDFAGKYIYIYVHSLSRTGRILMHSITNEPKLIK